MQVYLFAGLGTDERVFSNLIKFSKNEIIPLKWLPVKDAKTIEEYANFYLPFIDTTQEFALGGFSLGGLIAIELNKILKSDNLILISTAKTRAEFSGFFKALHLIPFHRFFNKSGILKAASIGDKFTIKSENGRTLFYKMLNDSNEDFLKFGAEAVVNWNNNAPPEKYIHIHGTKDLVFPIQNIKNAVPIRGANHFMIFERAEEIASLIDKYLDKSNP